VTFEEHVKAGLEYIKNNLPNEVKLTELQREQLEMTKRESTDSLRASCYSLTMNRLQAAKQEEKFNDLPYILTQADALFKFITDGTVPEANELNNKVISLRAVSDKPLD